MGMIAYLLAIQSFIFVISYVFKVFEEMQVFPARLLKRHIGKKLGAIGSIATQSGLEHTCARAQDSKIKCTSARSHIKPNANASMHSSAQHKGSIVGV
jgi:hypothetical protein